MKEYRDKAITVDDLERNEVGSLFERCSFIATKEKRPIRTVNFCYAVFNDCKFETRFVDCNLMSTSGNSLPSKKQTDNCNIRNMGDSEPREKWLQALPGKVVLSTDAEDTYQPCDGIPDILADGKDSCQIFIEKRNYAGELQQCDEVFDLECSIGYLDKMRVMLKRGKAVVKLTSVPQTVVSEIKVKPYDKASGISEEIIKIQFRPVEELTNG
jgi:hypothetical protein